MHNAPVIHLLQWTRVIPALAIVLFSFNKTQGQQRVLDNKMHHIRAGNKQEWLTFDRQAEGSRLIVHFPAEENRTEQTLSLNQYDVTGQWQVILNNDTIGELVTDEKYATTYFSIAAGKLKPGENELKIEPAAGDAGVLDDISIGHIILEERPLPVLLSEATIEAEIMDGDSKLFIPSKITITGTNGILQPVGAASNDHLAVRTGCIYTGNGKATFGLPAGTYTIYTGRGFEYGIDSVQITLKPGDHITKRFIIKKEVATEGWISCDTHIHTLTYSGHGDASAEERALTIAGEDIELAVITEHNKQVDIKETAAKMGVSPWFTAVTGNEVTTAVGHFNIFPVVPGTPVPGYKVKDWNELSQNINKVPGVKAIILNHARDTHNDFRPFDPTHHLAIAGMSTTGWAFPANAMEVMNSGAQQQNIMRLYEDWFGMLNRGYRLTPVGSSDSHDVSRYVVGQGRTYIRGTDTNAGKIAIDGVLNNFRAGKVMVSFGLLAEIVVDSVYGPGDLVPAVDDVVVSVRVTGPGWIQANHIALYANGQKIHEANIADDKTPGIKWKGRWILPKPKHDLFLVAIAEGPGNYLPLWPIPRPYQHTTPEWDPHVIGSSGAVWIDADNNGHFTSAYEYAKELVVSSNGDMSMLVKKLESFDEAVALQVAALLYENGINVTGTDVAMHLRSAKASTKAGFQGFIKALQESKR